MAWKEEGSSPETASVQHCLGLHPESAQYCTKEGFPASKGT